DRLVLALAPMITHIVEYRTRRAPACCDPDKLVQAGLAELVSVIEDYDYCEVSLQEFAWARVDRAVLEEVRRGASLLRRRAGPLHRYASAAY
ncbi:MAG TPA: hypothetical protein VMU39_05785, partial [Solirubrobacteraceae bacterium]|nr:hypothetical protein [Solirubrobacteraceae bacterium]